MNCECVRLRLRLRCLVFRRTVTEFSSLTLFLAKAKPSQTKVKQSNAIAFGSLEWSPSSTNLLLGFYLSILFSRIPFCSSSYTRRHYYSELLLCRCGCCKCSASSSISLNSLRRVVKTTTAAASFCSHSQLTTQSFCEAA